MSEFLYRQQKLNNQNFVSTSNSLVACIQACKSSLTAWMFIASPH